jgi:hypothetical protein
MIRAGTTKEINSESGDWVFVDIGFAARKKSCGVAIGRDSPKQLSFAELVNCLVELAGLKTHPLNIVIEAPLSVAFSEGGNPTARSIEKWRKKTRYWYAGLGCGVQVAAMYLLRAIESAQPSREIHLFEGFVSFKEKGLRSSHTSDVAALRDIVWNPEKRHKAIVTANELAIRDTDTISSAFKVMGLDYGVPPVLVVKG